MESAMALRKKTLIQVDSATGKTEEGLTVLVPIRQKLKDDFSMLTRQGLLMLAVDSDLKWEDWRVLAVYLGGLDFENSIDITQKDVAEILGMNKHNVSRSTKKLVDKNILIVESKEGRSKKYRLNVVYGWKGRIDKGYTDLFENDSKLIA